MNIYEFMGSHPWITLYLACFACGTCRVIILGLIMLVNRIMRHWNIHKHGYPPEYCDADGDFKPSTTVEISREEAE